MYEGNLCALAMAPPVTAGPNSGRGSWESMAVARKVGHSTWIEFLLVSKHRRNVNNGTHQSLCSKRVPMAFQPSVCGVLLLLLYKSCSTGPQLSLKRNYSKYKCTFAVVLERTSSVSSYAAILDPLLYYFSYDKMFIAK